jgi:hypothetical protein
LSFKEIAHHRMTLPEIKSTYLSDITSHNAIMNFVPNLMFTLYKTQSKKYRKIILSTLLFLPLL